jgi:hypothetical protein
MAERMNRLRMRPPRMWSASRCSSLLVRNWQAWRPLPLQSKTEHASLAFEPICSPRRPRRDVARAIPLNGAATALNNLPIASSTLERSTCEDPSCGDRCRPRRRPCSRHVLRRARDDQRNQTSLNHRRLSQDAGQGRLCKKDLPSQPRLDEPNGLVADVDATLGQQVLDVAKRPGGTSSTSTPQGGSPRATS